MCKFIIILFLSFVFGLENNFPNRQLETTIDFKKLSHNQMIDTLKFIKNDEMIIYLSQYRLGVEKILSIHKDSLELELLNNKWWSKKQYTSISPSSRLNPHKINPSHAMMLSINDINTIEVLKSTDWHISLLPIFMTIAILNIFGI